jgi:radical SAM superfamily enzyme YgiQ (UPF0313 family)
MKKISFVEPNFQAGPKELNAYYVPYSTGCLWAYVNQFDSIKENFKLETFIWRRDPIEEAIQKLEDSDIVGFSTYVWNKSYNNALAKRLKEHRPNIIILFGGPEPPIEKPKYYEKFPYIDLTVKKEGELVFKKILEAMIASAGFDHIPGLLINKHPATLDTGDSERITDLEILPSPYLTGVFDHLLEQHPEVRWNTILETNRGCPYACTFCDWGSLTYNKVKKFNLQRVFDEIDWIGQHGCDFVSITDANFGMFVERDMMIADKLIEANQQYGNPRNYTITWAKNQKREVIDIVKKFLDSGILKNGLNVSFQTLDDDVLEKIKRKNLELNKVEEVFAICGENNIPLYTELILGLPGETTASWKRNFWKLFKMGNHTGISVFQAQLLENAEMNLLQRKIYKIKGSTVWDYMEGNQDPDDPYKEGVEVIIATKDMPLEDMLDCQLFSWFIITCHVNGLTNWISRILDKHDLKTYEEFYTGFFEHCKKDAWFSEQIENIRTRYLSWMLDGKIDHPRIAGIQIHGWNLIHSTTIKIHVDQKYDHIFNLIGDYTKSLNVGLDNLDQLLEFQRLNIVEYNDLDQYPKVKQFDIDPVGCLLYDNPYNAPSKYSFGFPENISMSLQMFCENIFFGRRRNFGKAWIEQQVLASSL